MTKENKELLLKELCARLLYGVIVRTAVSSKILTCEILSVIIDGKSNFTILPYLHPMSSMTEKEKKEYMETENLSMLDLHRYPSLESYDWLNKHHFDYRGLIEKGLAFKAPEGMYGFN